MVGLTRLIIAGGSAALGAMTSADGRQLCDHHLGQARDQRRWEDEVAEQVAARKAEEGARKLKIIAWE
eukprot:gene31771-6969_t